MRKTGNSVPSWDTFFDVSKTKELWVVFSKYGEYNEEKPECGIENQIHSGRKILNYYKGDREQWMQK